MKYVGAVRAKIHVEHATLVHYFIAHVENLLFVFFSKFKQNRHVLKIIQEIESNKLHYLFITYPRQKNSYLTIDN